MSSQEVRSSVGPHVRASRVLIGARGGHLGPIGAEEAGSWFRETGRSEGSLGASLRVIHHVSIQVFYV